MKTKTLYLILALLPMVYGCSKPKKNDVMRDYLVLLHIQDVFGVDILKDIPRSLAPIRGIFDPISPELYTWEVVGPEEIRNTALMSSNRSGLSVWWSEEVDHYSLEIREGSSSLLPPVDMITFRFTCSYIFGDDVAHIIETHWKNRNEDADIEGQKTLLEDGTSSRSYCYRLTIDGIEFPVTQEPWFHYYNGKEDTIGGWDNLSIAWATKGDSGITPSP